jgi:hypothetical protein
MIQGVSRVFWEMDEHFLDPQPHVFQLQTGQTGNPDAVDWVNVGTPVTNGLMAEDDERRPGDYGKTLTTHYRVVLSTPVARYVSQPVSTYGILPEKDWVFAREMCRKEGLRHNIVSRDGYLLKRLRFGEKCTECLDPLTGGITNGSCPECGGTGFKVGYHPPIPMQLDMSPEAIIELRSATEPPGPSRPTDLKGRIKGFPHIEKEDVWVDAASDQRWFLHEVYHLAEWRGVPIVIQAGMRLAPFSDIVYTLEVGGEAAADPATLPKSGPGTIAVDHNYGGTDELAYTYKGEGIVGATILVYDKCTYDANIKPPADPNCPTNQALSPLISPDLAIASTATTANGRWREAVMLCPCGEYVLLFDKPGEFGPDVCNLTVLPEEGTCAPTPPSSSSSQQSDSSSSYSSSSSMGMQ